MASGIQTIANEGVHMEPYFVEYIDDCGGQPRVHALRPWACGCSTGRRR